MFILIDNYDSFSWNLVQYLGMLNLPCKVIPNDFLSPQQILSLNPEGIIISPGPGSPENSGCCPELIKTLACLSPSGIPVLGICLGHQILATSLGGEVSQAPEPVHGKISVISNNGQNLFARLPYSFKVVRYHSLLVTGVPDYFTVSAYADKGEIMAISSERYGFYGVQFHPESLLTEYGLDLLNNFAAICRRF